MATRLRNLLVLVFLCATCVRAEEELDYSNMVESEKTILTVADAVALRTLVVQLFTGGLLLGGSLYILLLLFAPYTETPRALGEGVSSILGRVLHSIDLMDVTFGVMEVEEESCRRRAVCELQRAASKMPFIGTFLQNISPSINGMEKYKEAQQSGSALEDCKVLFECPYSFLETN
ncbi:uncharacterized protein [Penaeus vannamei]